MNIQFKIDKTKSICSEISKVTKLNTKDFLKFIEINNLLKGFVDKRVYENLKDLGPSGGVKQLALYVVRQLNKDQFDMWCEKIKIEAKQEDRKSVV